MRSAFDRCVCAIILQRTGKNCLGVLLRQYRLFGSESLFFALSFKIALKKANNLSAFS